MTLARIKKGDLVYVIAGKERGKSGKVLQMLLDRDRVLVEKLNRVKRHRKPSQKNPQGGILEKEASLHISNLMPVCGKCKKPARVAMKILKDKKIRICRKCGESIELHKS